MRYAGTALLCMVAAFGAAFLIRRAVDHPSSGARGTVAADTRTASSDPAPVGSGHAEETAVRHRAHAPSLAAEFAPGVQRITRKRPKREHHRRHHAVSHSSGASEPSTTVSSTPTYTPTTSTYTPAPSEPTASSGGTTHKSSGSGTGTTSIGGSGKGSGTTTIG